MDEGARRRVLITGCSSGFGLLIAVGAAQAGFEVIATLRNRAKTAALERALAAAGVQATIDYLDVDDPRQIEATAARHSPVDILVNNAGILIAGSFLDLTDAEARRILETNYFGAIALTKAVVGPMIERRSGRIINIASLAGRVGHPFNAAYASSKHALIGFSRSIRVELAPFGIQVISVEPGYHRTEIIRSNANLAENFHNRCSPLFEYNRGFLHAMMKQVLPRAGDPQVVADLVVRLMMVERPRAHYVVGGYARLAVLMQRLGAMGWLEGQMIRYIRRARRLENQKETARKLRARPDHTAGAARPAEPSAR